MREKGKIEGQLKRKEKPVSHRTTGDINNNTLKQLDERRKFKVNDAFCRSEGIILLDRSSSIFILYLLLLVQTAVREIDILALIESKQKITTRTLFQLNF